MHVTAKPIEPRIHWNKGQVGCAEEKNFKKKIEELKEPKMKREKKKKARYTEMSGEVVVDSKHSLKRMHNGVRVWVCVCVRASDDRYDMIRNDKEVILIQRERKSGL